MKQATRAGCSAAAIGVVLALAALPALAQVPVSNQNGRAADANTRVGSSGFNEPSGRGPLVGPNQIIYRNVTGGAGFRGPVLERDPGAFTGPISGRRLDNFVRNSSGVPQPYQPDVSLNTPVPYYGASRGVPPPLGTAREGFTGGYIGTSLTPQSPLELSDQINPALLDWRSQPLGQSVILGTNTILPSQPGEVILQGPLEMQNQQAYYSGSPLYGVRRLPGQTQSDVQALSPFGPSAGTPMNPDQLRSQQLQQTMSAANPQFQGLQGRPASAEQNANTLEKNPPNPQNITPPDISNTFESPQNNPLNVGLDQSLSNGLARPTRAVITTPQQQSAQYDEMRRRMERYQNPQVAAMQSQLQASQQQQQQQARSRQGAAPSTQPATPAAIRPQAVEQATRVEALQVKSLATGIPNKDLRGYLEAAEDLMRQNRFQSAIEQYNAAEETAPDQPLVYLGRANAELGAGMFRQASTDLRRVFTTSRALLMGQYDLKAMMRSERLETITTQLKDLSASDKQDPMPPFLLAYVNYNTGNKADAAQYLSEAEARAHNTDPVLKLLRQYWRLSAPTGSGRQEFNK